MQNASALAVRSIGHSPQVLKTNGNLNGGFHVSRTNVKNAESDDVREEKILPPFISPHQPHENCTIDVVKVVLKHLQLDLVPNVAQGQHHDSPYPENGRRALLSISTLDHVLAACRRNQDLKEEVVGLLVDRDCVEGLCLWTNFFLHFGLSIPMDDTPGADFRIAYFTHAKFFCDLLNADPRIRAAVLTTPTFSDLLIRFWMTLGKNEESFMDFNQPQGCPIVHLFLKLVGDDDGRDVLYDQIFDRPPEFACDFAEAMVDRFRRCASQRVSITRAIAMADGLLTATTHLVSNRTIKQRFITADYLTTISSTFHSISMNVVNQELDLSHYLTMLIRPVHKLFQMASEGDYRLVGNWRDLVTGDFLPLLIRIMSNIRPNDRSPAKVCVVMLSENVLYLDRFHRVHPPFLTDVYLCPLPTDHRSSQSWYPHTSTRPFHTALLASIYTQSYNEMLANYASSSSNYMANRNPLNDGDIKHGFHSQAIPVISFISTTSSNGEIVTLETIERVAKGGRDQEMQVDFQRYSGYVERRYRELLDGQSSLSHGDGGGGGTSTSTEPTGTKARGPSTNTALVEGVFPHGDDTIVTLTVKLEKREAGGETRWEGVYSIVRFG
ncbi:hypothetical protein H1R20_g10542, partial [Candolleomyces eurysporus]